MMPEDDEPAEQYPYMGQVAPGIWIGSLASLPHLSHTSTEWTVISILSTDRLIRLASDMLGSASSSIARQHIVWKLPDTVRADLLDEQRLLQVFGILNDHHGACLLHCAQGVSRSVAVCAAWFISQNHVGLQDALRIIRKVRPEANPNLGFLASLRALEQCQGDIRQARKRLSLRSESNKESHI